MARKRKPPGPTAAEKRRQAARRAELRAEKKRAEEALRRKRSEAAKKGWESRRKKTTDDVASLVMALMPNITPDYIDSLAIKHLLHSEIITTRTRARRAVAMMRPQQRLALALKPLSHKKHREMAGDEDQKVDVENDRVNPFWYHYFSHLVES